MIVDAHMSSWRVRWCAAVLAACAVALTLEASAAHGAKNVLTTFGQAGTAEGEFTFPSGVAINLAAGDLYVADAAVDAGGAGGQRIEQFSADGSFIRAWGWGVATGADAFEVCTSACTSGIQGAGQGQFGFQVQAGDAFTHPQIAVDQSDGSVYVADTLNDRVQKFSASGAFLAAFGGSGTGAGQLASPQGVAVDPTSGDVYVADTANNRVQRFTGSGTFVAELGGATGGSGDGELLSPRRVAVDSTGRLYVLDDGNLRLQRFTAAGLFDGVFGSASVFVNPPTSGSSPSELAVDPSTDHVYVSGMPADFSAAYAIVELDASGATVDVHARDVGETFGGLAVRSSTGRIYASGLFSKRLLILDDVPVPTATIDPVSGIGSEEATFSGAVNSQGPPETGYHFEYSTDGIGWTSAPGSDVFVGAGTSDVAVSEAVSKLAPNTEYRVRLVATKRFNAGSAVSDEATFRTDPVPPIVRVLGVGSRTDTMAWLGGEVNPRNSQTSAYIEYTLESDTAFADASRLPAPSGTIDVGAVNAFVPVTQLANGLEPGTVYRFRVVATNAAGTSVGPDRTFITREAPPPPPAGRGYEMVSPLDKNGGDIDRNLGGISLTSRAAASGDGVSYPSLARFADLAGGQAGQYRSVRNDKRGWATQAINPPFETDSRRDGSGSDTWFLSDDLSAAVVTTNFPLDLEAPLLGGKGGLYLRSDSGSSSSYRLLSIPSGPLPPSEIINPFDFAAATPDMRHVVFESRGQQLTEEPMPSQGVYEWVDGQVRLVSKLPSGATAGFGKAGAEIRGGLLYPGDHPISDDGQRIYFSDGLSPESPLYVREGGSETTAVSVSERDEDEPSEGEPPVVHPARFLAAKADDGSLALFTSVRRLTDDPIGCAACVDAARNLYLWKANAPEGERLSNLTGAESGGGVLGLAAVADDFSRAYFVATGALTEEAVDDSPNLYVWSPSRGVRHVAALAGGDAAMWGVNREDGVARYRDARLSADGTRLLFTSGADLTAQGTGGTKQVYLYDDSNARLTCVSCGESAPSGESWLFYSPSAGLNGSTLALRAPYGLPRNLSADGRRVFFETAQSLAKADTNGKADVYMWEGGELSLISTGRSAGGSEFIDASADGRDVFFTTRERLVGADIDNRVDAYDARIGGGFPKQQNPPECVGDECQGLLAPSPKLMDPGGGSSSDASPGSASAFSVRSLSSAQRRALAAGRRVTLSVRVGKPGRVVVRGTARVAGRAWSVMSASRRATRPGTVQVGLRLSKLGRKRLAASGRLRVSLKVRFAGENRVLMLGLVRLSSGGRNP